METQGDRGEDAPKKPQSFGNMGPDHWSRARAGENAEAMAYLRARSHAPGVEAGGAARNYYCMKCDGVIPHDPALESCPHCGVALEGATKRYFNWVEINDPPSSDLAALLGPILGLAAVGVVIIAIGVLLWKLSGG